MRRSPIFLAALLTAGLVAAFAVDAASQAVFSDVTASCGVQYSGFVGRSWDAVIGDINGDGIQDLYCMGHAQGRTSKGSLLYWSNGALGLSNVTGSAFSSITATGGGQGAMLFDLDSDGDLDLLTGSNDGVGVVLENQGNGSFDWYDRFETYYGNFFAREITGGDIDGDGDQDILIGVHHNPMRLATNDGSGAFSIGLVSYAGSHSTCGATLPILADMDNDGDLDVIAQYMSAFGSCATERPSLLDYWRNDGNGVFEWVSDTHGLMGGEEEGTLLVADFDNDGDLDIVQLTASSAGVNGVNRYYVNDGAGQFSEQANSRGLGGNTPFTDWWAKSICGDFDNDGDLDIFYRNALWTNNGSGSFSHRTLSGYSGGINAAGDLDGDGDLDLAGARTYWEPAGDGFWVYRNETNTNGWLQVRADAGALNPYGVGAKVTVFSGSQRLGYRQVIAASAMQQPLEQHFGLGSAAVVRVEVLFPDGTLSVRNNVLAGQRIVVTKDGNPVVPSTPSAFVASGTDVGCADLSWNTPASAETVTEYVLAWGSFGSAFTDSISVSAGVVQSQGGTSSYQHCLGASGTFCFALRAHNAFGQWSAYSTTACASITEQNTQPPSPPTNVTAVEIDFGDAAVAWTPSGDPRVTGYMVFFGNSSSSMDDSVDAQGGSNTVVPGLSAGTYFFTVHAYIASGERSAPAPLAQLVMEGLDVATPTLSALAPTEGAVAVPVTTPITFTIADDKTGVDQASVVVKVDGVAISNLVFAGAASAYAVTAVPDDPFPGLATVTIEVTAADLASSPNTMSQSWSFGTDDISSVDEGAPTFRTANPSEGTWGVPADAHIRITMTDEDAGVDAGSLVLEVNGASVAFDVSGGIFDMTLVYPNPLGFEPGSTVSVRIVACDLSNPAKCGELQFSFHVAPGAPDPASAQAVVMPDGYWAGEPTRPLEIQNLPVNWGIRIFDAAGLRVRTYENNSAKNETWMWDFANANGQQVARGLYLVRVSAPDGTLKRSARFLVQVDP